MKPIKEWLMWHLADIVYIALTLFVTVLVGWKLIEYCLQYPEYCAATNITVCR